MMLAHKTLPKSQRHQTPAWRASTIVAFIRREIKASRVPSEERLAQFWIKNLELSFGRLRAQVFLQQGAVFDGGTGVERAARLGQFQEEGTAIVGAGFAGHETCFLQPVHHL